MLLVSGKFSVDGRSQLPIRYAEWVMSRELLGVSRGLFPCRGYRHAFDWLLSPFVDGRTCNYDTQGDLETRAAGCESRTIAIPREVLSWFGDGVGLLVIELGDSAFL